MKICRQVLLVTWESCANVTFESCELFVLQCALPQSFQLVVIILTAIIGNFMLSSGPIGVIWLRASATGMSTPFLKTTLKGRYGNDLTMSLYPWADVNHMLLVDTYKWLLVGFQCEFLSIQEVVELFHSPDSSKCLSLQILIILFSLCQGSGSIAYDFPLLD